MRTIGLLAGSSLLICALSWAQTSQIDGTIKDSTGLAIPGAAIKVTQTATGIVRTAISGGEGAYVLPNLPIGPYLLEVSKEGFAKYAQKGIVLQVDTNPAIDVNASHNDGWLKLTLAEWRRPQTLVASPERHRTSPENRVPAGPPLVC